MDHIQWQQHPELDDPVLVAAFSGWNDAGDAASTAVRYLVEHCEATLVATVDPEEFYDFTFSRPHIRAGDGDERTIEWSTVEIYAGTLPNGRDVLFAVGPEPHLRWRTFSEELLKVLDSFEGTKVLLLGALVAEVPHSRPVQVAGNTDQTDDDDDWDLPTSTYEGPTGIVGVLAEASRKSPDKTTTSLWATVPPYVPSAPSPKAALALVEQTAAVLDMWLATTDLEIAAVAYENQVSELVAEDEETTDYVHELERRHDENADQHGRVLVEEVERYLRDRGY